MLYFFFPGAQGKYSSLKLQFRVTLVARATIIRVLFAVVNRADGNICRGRFELEPRVLCEFGLELEGGLAAPRGAV